MAISSKTTSVKEILSKHSRTEPSCLEREFSQRTAREMARMVWKLISDVYQGKCRNASPLTATIHQIADFIVYLCRDESLLVSPINALTACGTLTYQ